MKLLHIADLHLDSPFTGLTKQLHSLQKHLIQSPYQAFERCVSIAINQAVDLMVIAGDIYDTEQQTVTAQHFFLKQLERLHIAKIPVVVGWRCRRRARSFRGFASDGRDTQPRYQTAICEYSKGAG